MKPRVSRSSAYVAPDQNSDMMTWQLIVRTVMAWLVKPDPFCRKSGKEGVCGTSMLVGSPDVGACRRVQACKTSVLHQVFTSGFVWSSSTRWLIHYWRIDRVSNCHGYRKSKVARNYMLNAASIWLTHSN